MLKLKYAQYAALASLALGTISLFMGALLKINSSPFVTVASFLLGGGIVLMVLGFFALMGLLLRNQLEAKPEVLDLEEFAKAREKEPILRDTSEDLMV
ncbi:MAG: hypothetical protein AAGF89_03495 [Bacteroidota bacterium]